MHVVEPPAEPATPEQRAGREWEAITRLRALIPEDAAERGIDTRFEIVEAGDAADAIRGAAERLGVDLICLASHGRSGLAATLAGSVARGVLRSTTRPLLVIGPPRGD
jgi:nucleotide-binding universal stress UspA family protein